MIEDRNKNNMDERENEGFMPDLGDLRDKLDNVGEKGGESVTDRAGDVRDRVGDSLDRDLDPDREVEDIGEGSGDVMGRNTDDETTL